MSVFEDLRNGKPYDVRDEQYKKEAHGEFNYSLCWKNFPSVWWHFHLWLTDF